MLRVFRRLAAQVTSSVESASLPENDYQTQVFVCGRGKGKLLRAHVIRSKTIRGARAGAWTWTGGGLELYELHDR